MEEIDELIEEHGGRLSKEEIKANSEEAFWGVRRAACDDRVPSAGRICDDRRPREVDARSDGLGQDPLAHESCDH